MFGLVWGKEMQQHPMNHIHRHWPVIGVVMSITMLCGDYARHSIVISITILDQKKYIYIWRL